MAGEIQLNSTTMATESSGSITAELDTIRPNTTNGSLTLQGDSSNAGVTGLTIDSSGVVNTTTAKVTNIQATSGQSLTIKDEDGNAAITIGTDNTAAGYLSLNFGSYHGDSGGAGSGSLSANTLDDYEVGTDQVTLTPTTSGSFTMDTTRDTFKYIKIGNVCHVLGYARVSSVSSPQGAVTFNLPFTSAASTEFSGYTFGICIPENITTINSNELSVRVVPSTSTAQIRRTGGGGTTADWISFANYFTSNTNITVMLTYQTA